MNNFQEFWKDPVASSARNDLKLICKPEFYLGLYHVTEMVVSTLSKYLDKSDSILELGSGTGRNLAGLVSAGFTHVSGVEINAKAIALGRLNFIGLLGVKIQNAAIEDLIKDVPEVDCIFTQGVLMHLPPQSEWVFEVISRKARKIIMTSENEKYSHSIAWHRDYGKIFTGFGWQQMESQSCEKWEPLPDTTIMRVFKKEVKDESPSPQLPEQGKVVDPSPKRKGHRVRK